MTYNNKALSQAKLGSLKEPQANIVDYSNSDSLEDTTTEPSLTKTEEQPALLESAMQPIDRKKYNEMINKENKRKNKWNAYMRNYNARKKREHEEQLNKIVICFNNIYKSYHKDVLLNVLRSIITTYTTIINNNINRIPDNIIENINNVYTSNDILKYINYLNEIVKELLY
ncbi:hypothetical protein M9Y10_013234 [Tritrichomonas musculus]|uniref:Uncharacterized protein n=1 Tax=Tritrichomonas musculus TaxID=1915356 RepID=A0ABR2I6J4_9EUKA